MKRGKEKKLQVKRDTPIEPDEANEAHFLNSIVFSCRDYIFIDSLIHLYVFFVFTLHPGTSQMKMNVLHPMLVVRKQNVTILLARINVSVHLDTQVIHTLDASVCKRNLHNDKLTCILVTIIIQVD